MTVVVYHLPQIPVNILVNDFFVRPDLKIPGTNGNSEKVVPFSRLGRDQMEIVYHLQVS